MVFLVLILFALIPLLYAFGHTTASGLQQITTSFSTVNSSFIRFVAVAGSISVIALIAVPLVMITVPQLSDFRTPGDGGVGLAFNAITKIATYLMIPAITCWLAGYLISTLSCKPSDRPTQED